MLFYFQKKGTDVWLSFIKMTQHFWLIYGITIIIIIIIIYNCKWVFNGGSGTTITHNTQNNTPRSNETQHTKLHTQ
jgi:hypothetical protein